MHFNKGFIENFLLANNILTLKWKTKIIAVAAVAMAKPILPYANKQSGMPIFPVFGKINGGSNLYISLLRIFKITIPITAKINTYKVM